MKLKSLVSLVILASVFAACSNTDFQKTKGGVPYKIFGDNKGEKIAVDNIVKFHITQKIKDSLISTTYGQFPRYEKVSAAIASYDVRNIIMDVLLHAHKGDSIYITMAMDSFIAKDPTIVEKTPFRKGDQILTTVRVLDVFKTGDEAQKDVEKENISMFNKDPKIQEQKKKDEKAIEDYLAANNIKATKTTWGTYIQTITPGTGPKANPGQYAMLRYKGMDFSGKEFDSNMGNGKPLMPLQVGAGGAIVGFEDAVRQLSKGEKARIYIPSVLGYGVMGSPPMIQPNQNLMFDLEVVDITSNPPAPPQMPQQQGPRDTTRH